LQALRSIGKLPKGAASMRKGELEDLATLYDVPSFTTLLACRT